MLGNRLTSWDGERYNAKYKPSNDDGKSLHFDEEAAPDAAAAANNNQGNGVGALELKTIPLCKRRF